MLILGVAPGFANYLVDAEVPSRLIDWVQLLVQSKYLFLLMDIFAAILVAVPVFKPLAAAYSIDPVHMGVIFIAKLELVYLHPTVGIKLRCFGVCTR